MTRAKKSPAGRKARKNRSRSQRLPLLDFKRNSWTVKIAARWAGIPERTLYRLLREGVVPCLRMGETQIQSFRQARNGKRRRICFRFIIPRVAFIHWWEGIAQPETNIRASQEGHAT